SVVVIEWRTVIQESPEPFADGISGNSHIPGISEECCVLCIRNTEPLRRSSRYLISFFFWRALVAILGNSPLVAHKSDTGQRKHLGCRGTQTVAPNSIMA